MKLHTSLTETEVRDALARAKTAGNVAAHVVFDVFTNAGSNSHPNAYEVHLATPQNVMDSGTKRPFHQSGESYGKRKIAAYANGNGLRYAATRDEWGWFLAELFDADPDAKAGPYKNLDDFNRQTRFAYVVTAL